LNKYEVIYQALDNLETMEAVYIDGESQTDAMNKLRTFLIDNGRVVDYIFSVSKVAA
jgi:DNA-dependent RNA polymerase auxiliary subunit epsilon